MRTGKRITSTNFRPSASVHPRAYGEEKIGLFASCQFGGSPPCVRGRDQPGFRQGIRRRFTPVRTGKRPAKRGSSCCPAVHPRAYGEEFNAKTVEALLAGSPPCVRGRVQAAGGYLDAARFTPVRTGKRCMWMPRPSRSTVHPRAYGEERTSESGRSARNGSPPCVRGRGRLRTAGSLRWRFTPVRTGKSCCRNSFWHMPAVHPRAYGEEDRLRSAVGGVLGSPPCVRGRVVYLIPQVGPRRFTPVRTGKRRIFGIPPVGPSVHPRAYGEEGVPNMFRAWRHGSPPCVRGRVPQRCVGLRDHRFTPVRTGKSSTCRSSSCCSTVHPRAYGEEQGVQGSGATSAGSPPCVRGRDRVSELCGPRRRFTPVRTGKRLKN